MTQRKVVLIAQDYLESKMISGLSAQRLQQSFVCTTLVGEGKIPSPISQDDVRSAVAASDIVIVAASENCDIEAYAGACAREYGKPLVMMALAYNTWSRKEFAPIRAYLSLLFVLDEEEAQLAKHFFPAATIVATGNPEWESFSLPAHTSRQVHDMLDISTREKFILVSGEKEVSVNIPLGINVIEAVADQPHPENFVVVFTIHPGHTPLPGGADLLEFYQRELGGYHPSVRVATSLKATPFGIGTPDMVVGADLVIGTNSTVQIQAAMLGIPAIAILLRRAFRGTLLPKEHAGWWPPCDYGAIAPVYGLSSTKTAQLIKQLLAPRGAETMQMAQRQILPPRRVGFAYRVMTSAIKRL